MQVLSTPQQRVSPVRAGLTASTRRAAAHRSRAARVQAMALRRHAPPPTLLARRMTVGQAPRQAQQLRSRAWKHHSRRPAIGPSRTTTQPALLRAAAREAQQAQSRSQRALTSARRRAHSTRAPPPAAKGCAQQEDQTAGQAQSSSQGGLAGSEQGSAARLDISSETHPCHNKHPQRSRAAARAAAQRRRMHAHELPAVALDSQHALHCVQKHLSKVLAKPRRLMAAIRAAALTHGRAHRADAQEQKRDQLTRSSLSATEDEPAAAAHSLLNQPAQQGSPMQVISAYRVTAVYSCRSALLVSLTSAAVQTWLTQPLHSRPDKHQDILSH